MRTTQAEAIPAFLLLSPISGTRTFERPSLRRCADFEALALHAESRRQGRLSDLGVENRRPSGRDERRGAGSADHPGNAERRSDQLRNLLARPLYAAAGDPDASPDARGLRRRQRRSSPTGKPYGELVPFRRGRRCCAGREGVDLS